MPEITKKLVFRFCAILAVTPAQVVVPCRQYSHGLSKKEHKWSKGDQEMSKVVKGFQKSSMFSRIIKVYQGLSRVIMGGQGW